MNWFQHLGQNPDNGQTGQDFHRLCPIILAASQLLFGIHHRNLTRWRLKRNTIIIDSLVDWIQLLTQEGRVEAERRIVPQLERWGPGGAGLAVGMALIGVTISSSSGARPRRRRWRTKKTATRRRARHPAPAASSSRSRRSSWISRWPKGLAGEGPVGGGRRRPRGGVVARCSGQRGRLPTAPVGALARVARASDSARQRRERGLRTAQRRLRTRLRTARRRGGAGAGPVGRSDTAGRTRAFMARHGGSAAPGSQSGCGAWRLGH
jgi:hypothetical protein